MQGINNSFADAYLQARIEKEIKENGIIPITYIDTETYNILRQNLIDLAIKEKEGTNE